MSIPKEPRQLMINLMYLVLTAMLALNVSAEIFNAFKIVDKGIVKANEALDKSNDALPQAIRDGAKKKNSLATYAERIDPAREEAAALSAEIEQIINALIDKSGDNDGSVGDGDYVMRAGLKELRGKKNKDVTTRYLVKGTETEEAVGEVLKAKLLAFSEKMMTFVDAEDSTAFKASIPVIVDDKTWREKDGKKSWSEFNFKQMPVQATIPILRKFQNDVIGAEAAVLNYLAGKVGTTTDVVLDKYTVVSAPEKSYIIKGEKYKTDLFLSAYASADSKTGITISVDGRRLTPNSEGVATFEETASSTGKKNHKVTGTITNPVTGERQTFTKDFSYEVGERSANVSADKMNVFYVGVDNPVSVTAAGIPSTALKVNGSGGGITMNKASSGKYNVRVTQPNQKATITVSGGGLENTKFEFRVKRIPDPVARLGNIDEGSLGNGPFKAQLGVAAHLDNFDFEAKCQIQGFGLVRVEKRKDAQFSTNPSGRFNAESKRLVMMAKPGDTYFFENIKAKCPGDSVGRKINSLVFKIK